jgi:hypothetical protein
MPAFSGTLNPNEIFSSLFNMIISQQINADNIKEGFSSLVNRARVDGGLYGDTKLYYDTDVLKSNAWGGDTEAANLLSLDRPADPECQAIMLNTFRQIRVTVDYYLSKRAWKDEGAFSQFNSVTLGWLRETKKVYDQTTYNVFIGTHVSSVQADKEITLSGITAAATTADEESMARIRAQLIGKGIADLMIAMKDVSRDFNDYAHLKSYDEDEITIIFNSAYVNEITYLDLPTIFHKEGIVKKINQDLLPSRYFGNVLAASKTVGATDDVRACYEQEITVSGVNYHLFAGDKFPVGAVVASGDGYEVDATIIAKVVTKLPPYMSAFEVGTSFFNPRSLTENHYLTFGHNELEHLYAHPFVRVVEN